MNFRARSLLKETGSFWLAGNALLLQRGPHGARRAVVAFARAARQNQIFFHMVPIFSPETRFVFGALNTSGRSSQPDPAVFLSPYGNRRAASFQRRDDLFHHPGARHGRNCVRSSATPAHRNAPHPRACRTRPFGNHAFPRQGAAHLHPTARQFPPIRPSSSAINTCDDQTVGTGYSITTSLLSCSQVSGSSTANSAAGFHIPQ